MSQTAKDKITSLSKETASGAITPPRLADVLSAILDVAQSGGSETGAEPDAELTGRVETLEASVSELQAAVWPTEVVFGASRTVVETGVATNVSLNWSVRRKGADITSDCTVTLNGVAVQGSSMVTTLNMATAGSVKYTLRCVGEGLDVTRTLSVSVAEPSYFGVVAKEWTPTEASVTALQKSVQTGRDATRTNLSVQGGRICWCYPASRGELTSVKDGNGYEVLGSYTRSTVRIKGVDYHCYLLTEAITASGVTQIYK